MSATSQFLPQPLRRPDWRQNILQMIVRILISIGTSLYYILEAFFLKFVPSRLRYKSVAGEIVLVTGASSGIGRLIAIKFASLGANVVCWDIDKDGLDETVNHIKNKGGTGHSYVCDVADRQTVYTVAKAVRDEVGKVSIIINNAGITFGKCLMELSDTNIEKTFAVNCLAHYWIVKAFLADMQQANHGHIVSIASLAGQIGVSHLTDYCGSKFAAVGFAESLALELHRDGYTGIRVTTICPYFISTGMFYGVGGAFSFMTPEYVANETVKSLLLNKDVVVLPPYLFPLVILKNLIPAKLLSFVSHELGFLHCMETFKPEERHKKSI